MELDTPGNRMFGDDLTSSDLALFRTGGEFESLSPPSPPCRRPPLRLPRGGTLAIGAGLAILAVGGVMVIRG